MSGQLLEARWHLTIAAQASVTHGPGTHGSAPSALDGLGEVKPIVRPEGCMMGFAGAQPHPTR